MPDRKQKNQRNSRWHTIPAIAVLGAVIEITIFMFMVNADDESELIRSISDEFGIASVILICEEQNSDIGEHLMKMLQVQKTLNGMFKLYTSILTIQSLKDNILSMEDKKLLVVIYVRPETLKAFISVLKNIDVHRVSWLWISCTFELDTEIFGNKYIPFHTKFFYAFREDDNNYIVKEIYQNSEKSQKKINHYGKLMNGKELVVVKGEFFNRRKDLSELHLKYLLKDGFDTCNLSFVRNPTVLECVNWKIWKDFEKIFNFTSEYLPHVADHNMRHANAGLSKIRNHEVDGASWSLIVTSSRLEQNDFLWPIVITKFIIYTKVPEIEINLSSYLQPLSFELWLAILAWMFVMIFVMTFTKWIIIRLLTKRKFVFLRDGLDDSVAPFLALCSQGMNMLFGQDMLTVRALIMMIYIVSLFLLPAYSGGLISSLGNPPSRVPFTNIDEFGKNGKYKIITLRNSFVHKFLETDMTFASVRRESLTWTAEEMPIGDDQAFDLICENALSYFIDQPVFLKNRPPCKLFTMNQLFGSFTLTMAVAKDFPFTEIFKRSLQRRRISGISDKELEKIVLNGLGVELELRTEKSSKGVFQEAQFEYSKAFTLANVLPIFLVLLVGLLSSIFLLLLELLHYRKLNEKTKAFPF